MSLRDVTLKKEYRSFQDNISKDFYIPLLSLANLYQRAVGFFSSTALCVITPGLKKFVDNGGKIQLVASPKLSEEDLQAIKTGYEARDKVIQKALLREMKDALNQQEADRLKLLADLIASGVLDIKIVVTIDNNEIGMYHEKLGLIHDKDGNTVAFSGSMNESSNALCNNYEAFDVFCSWDDADFERIIGKQASFDAIWNNYEVGIEVEDFVDVKAEFIKRYKNAVVHGSGISDSIALVTYETQRLKLPENIQLYDYQIEAIDTWCTAGYRGIFDMATGTGKTFTGLGAVARLCENVEKLAIIIVCPYQHLVDQWVDDIKVFGMQPIIGYSSSPQKNFKKVLKTKIFDFNLGVIPYFCFICTNATFRKKEIQDLLNKVSEDAVLVVDEAHNFGAKDLSKTMGIEYKYRLALSATLERFNDEEGTNKLYRYFGEKCIEYSLERAIEEGKLTPYYYHPIVVYLSEDELAQYEKLTLQIAKCIVKKNGKTKLNQLGEQLAIKRSRIVAGAIEKCERLQELMQDYLHEDNMLIYCGATNLLEQDNDIADISADIRQIDYISQMLNFKLGMTTAQFTSCEDMEERRRRIHQFQSGQIQALVAIKCLDEGMNIPAIKTAFILASTTNPKEYIQRRGRVLRLAPGKQQAIIYDFVTLPRPLNTVLEKQVGGDLSLVKNELRRMYEFSRIAINSYDTVHIMDDIAEAYHLFSFLEELMLGHDEGGFEIE